jgi:hypothetical protein
MLHLDADSALALLKLERGFQHTRAAREVLVDAAAAARRHGATGRQHPTTAAQPLGRLVGAIRPLRRLFRLSATSAGRRPSSPA